MIIYRILSFVFFVSAVVAFLTSEVVAAIAIGATALALSNAADIEKLERELDRQDRLRSTHVTPPIIPSRRPWDDGQ